MNMNKVIEEYERLRVESTGMRNASKSYPVIVSQSSMEREVINNVNRMSIDDRQYTNETYSNEINNSINIPASIVSTSPLASPQNTNKGLPSPLASSQNNNSPNSNRQQTSVITHSGLTKTVSGRMRLMKRQEKIDEDDTRGLFTSQSFDNTYQRSAQDNFSRSQYNSFDNSLAKRYHDHQQFSIKSKSLDLHNEFRPQDTPLQYRPYHSSASDSISSKSSEDDLQYANSPNKNATANSPYHPYFTDPYNIKNESSHSLPVNDTRLSQSPVSQELLDRKAFKYGQKRAYSSNTHPYDRINVMKSLRRIYSEEAIVAPYDTKSKMRRSSSYNTLKDLSRTSAKPVKQESKNISKMIFPADNNVSAYRNVFLKSQSEGGFSMSQQAKHHQLNNLDFVNYLNNSLNFKAIDDDEIKKSQQSSKQPKATNLKNVDSSLIPPYAYDKTIDNELAVGVTGLLTLPGSNEKRYPITVGELRRRISPPEYLNKVDMISYVRLAKTTARVLLEKHAIRPKHHCRKSKHSVISKMCEAECTELATGIKKLSEEYFPTEWIARKSLTQFLDENDSIRKEEEMRKKQNKIEAARSVLKDLQELLSNSTEDEQMQSYSLVTHTYGLMDLTNNISLVDDILEKQIQCLTNTREKLNTNELSNVHNIHSNQHSNQTSIQHSNQHSNNNNNSTNFISKLSWTLSSSNQTNELNQNIPNGMEE